jgi:IS5 family transposase
MQGKTEIAGQSNFLYQGLAEQLNAREPLYKLAHAIPWKKLEEELAPYYSHEGQPAKPIRLMVSLLLLKQVEGLSDEEVVVRWKQNPYYQYLSGEVVFQWKQPCDGTDLVYFRKRIGKKGVERILAMTVGLHGKDGQEKDVVMDTTVQEKNITFPTDSKLCKKIIDSCAKIAKEEGIPQRQSYKRKSKQLLRQQHNRKHPKRIKQALRAAKKLKTIAMRVVRELMRTLPPKKLKKYQEKLAMYKQVIEQKRDSKEKIYSLHEPKVACIAKGKADKPYEFGSKVSVTMTKGKGIVVGVTNFTGNPHDSTTIEASLQQVKEVQGKEPDNVFVDRGYKGKKKVGISTIHVAGAKKGETEYEKKKLRNNFRRRAAVEPRIGHLKNKMGMGRNFLKGVVGDEINAIMAGAARNIRLWMRDKDNFFAQIFQYLFLTIKFNFCSQ